MATTEGLAKSQISHEAYRLNWHNFSLCRIWSQSTPKYYTSFTVN